MHSVCWLYLNECFCKVIINKTGTAYSGTTVMCIYLCVISALLLILHLEKLSWAIECLIVPDWWLGVVCSQKGDKVYYLWGNQNTSLQSNAATLNAGSNGPCTEGPCASRLNIYIRAWVWNFVIWLNNSPYFDSVLFNRLYICFQGLL